MDVLFILERREAGFEDLNAIVRWTIARIRLDGFDTLRSARGRTATNLAGTSKKDTHLSVNTIKLI